MSWMQTYTGGKFFVNEPHKTKFDIEDIAHALSNLCRFGGHTRQFYSVADHSILVADIVKARGGSVLQELWGLMHDATEAYMIDVPTPIKATLPGYEAREHELMTFIATALELPAHGEAGLLPALIKQADMIALVTEARQLVRGTDEWEEKYRIVDSHPIRLYPHRPDVAKNLFLGRYLSLTRQLNSR
jgi:hypothetical protein